MPGIRYGVAPIPLDGEAVGKQPLQRHRGELPLGLLPRQAEFARQGLCGVSQVHVGEHVGILVRFQRKADSRVTADYERDINARLRGYTHA